MRNDPPKGNLKVLSLPSLPMIEPCPRGTLEAGDRLIATSPSGRPYRHMQESLIEAYAHFPALMDADGAPWQLGNLYLLSLTLNNPPADFTTLLKTARSLAHFESTLRDRGLDLLSFPKRKANRPTYAYHLYWMTETNLFPKKINTANAHISRIIGFYRWLSESREFVPEHKTWEEKTARIGLAGSYGAFYQKEYKRTDLHVPSTSKGNHSDLRAYEESEQKALIEALISIDNTEMTLGFFIALLSGARLQSVFTMQVAALPKEILTEIVAIPIGRGTHVDSKGDKQHILYLPKFLCEMLKTYLASDRYKNRVEKSLRKNQENEYVFLTRDGRPYYAKKNDPYRSSYRTAALGKAITTFIRQQLEPKLTKLGHPFTVRFHDLRATFGDNFVEEKLQLLNTGEISLSDLYTLVAERLGHSDIKVTETYINKVKKRKLAAISQAKFEEHIQNQIQRLFGELNATHNA